MKHIYLVRHGRQNSRRCNVDVPLSDQGKEQAKLLGKRLGTYGIQKIYSSHLLRAVETANVVNEVLAVPTAQDPAWKEIDFGDLTGHSDEYNREVFSWFFQRQLAMTSDLPYPNGENGQDVVNRALPKLKELSCQNEDAVLVVTHGGLIRAVVAALVGTPMKNKLSFGKKLENTSITHIIFDEETERFRVERFNDYAHLEDHPHLLRDQWKVGR